MEKLQRAQDSGSSYIINQLQKQIDALEKEIKDLRI